MTPDSRSLVSRFDMTDKHALVTGAASGIGLGIAKGMLEFGAHVTMVDIDSNGLAAVVQELNEHSTKISTRQCNIADPDQVTSVVAEAAAAQGGLDAVFANAGIAGGPSIESDEGRIYDFDWEQYQQALAVNLGGTLATIRAAATAMRPASKGSIVVTVSSAGLRGDSMVGYGYNTSKGAVTNLVRQAAIDLARDGIRVNGIAPGPFFTSIGGPGPSDPIIEQAWADTTLLGRMAQTHEIQGLALLLASDAGSYMTGAIYPIDGGATTGSFKPAHPSSAEK